MLGGWPSFLPFMASSLCRIDCKDFRARILVLAPFWVGDLEQVFNLGVLCRSNSNDNNTFLIGMA